MEEMVWIQQEQQAILGDMKKGVCTFGESEVVARTAKKL